MNDNLPVRNEASWMANGHGPGVQRRQKKTTWTASAQKNTQKDVENEVN